MDILVDLDKKSTFNRANFNSEADDSYLTLCLMIQEEAEDDLNLLNPLKLHLKSVLTRPLLAPNSHRTTVLILPGHRS